MSHAVYTSIGDDIQSNSTVALFNANSVLLNDCINEFIIFLHLNVLYIDRLNLDNAFFIHIIYYLYDQITVDIK